jgi:flagellar hook protein FlgE
MGSSLFAGVSGLQAHQEMLDVVGNNLANINTTGFKSQRTEFADLLYQTIKPGAGTLAAGVSGTDPIQLGVGVQVAGISQSQTQGGLESTGGAFDMAISGTGFFVVNNGTTDLYTRAGAFDVDANNFLIDPTTGFRVQRFGTVGEATATTPGFQVPGDSSIRIPFGTAIPGQETRTVTLQGNLSATALGPLAQTLTSAQAFTSGGSPATGSTLLNSLDDKQVNYGGTDSLRIQTTTASGTTTTTFGVGATTTLGNVVSQINTQFAGVATASIVNGNIVLTAANTGPNPQLNLVISDSPGNTGVGGWANHTMTTTTVGKTADTLNSSIQIFDTQGTAHTLTLTFVKQAAANTWNMTASIPTSDGTMTNNTVTGITFNPDGSFNQITGTNPFITFQINGLNVPQTIGFNFGTSRSFNGLTQFGGTSTAAAKNQDGFAPGFLSNVSVGSDGTLNGVFTNGQILPIAQLAIATFNNPAGLNRQGNNFFNLSSSSGLALLGPGLSGGRGSVQQGVLESSNVDVALEFTRLIIAQRGFQVNARTISTSNDILQDLVTIIR